MPPEVTAARDELEAHSRADLIGGTVLSSLGVVLLPVLPPVLLVVLATLQPTTLVASTCLVAAAALSGAHFGIRAWRARAARIAELRARVEGYAHANSDPRWPGAQELLLRLRGEDPHSEQAHAVYPIARALAMELALRERSVTRGEDTSDPDARVDALLDDLRDAGAALSRSDDARLLADLRAATEAEEEVASLRTRAAAARRHAQPT